MRHTERDTAVKAAKWKLGKNAKEGRDFYITGRGKSWSWGRPRGGRTYPWQGKFKNRAEVDTYFADEELTCLLCGAPFGILTTHLRLAHKMSTNDYRDQYDLPGNRGLVGTRTREKMQQLARRQFCDPAKGIERGFLLARERPPARKRETRKPPDWVIQENAVRRQEGANRRLLATMKKARVVTDAEILKHIRQPIPASMPREPRDEVTQEMALAIEAGKLLPWDIESRAPEFVAAFYRQNPGKYGPLSLDAPLRAGGNMTLGDRITSDAFHF